MEKSAHRDDYKRLIEVLTQMRNAAGITQQELANKLKKPQSFVAKYEGRERRLDIVEFIDITKQIGADYKEVLEKAGF